MVFGKEGAAVWIQGDWLPSPWLRAEPYPSTGDCRDRCGCSLTAVFSLWSKAFDDGTFISVAGGSRTRGPFRRLSPNCLIRSGWMMDRDKTGLKEKHYKCIPYPNHIWLDVKWQLTCFSGSFAPVAATFSSKSFSLQQWWNYGCINLQTLILHLWIKIFKCSYCCITSLLLLQAMLKHLGATQSITG